MFNSYLIKSKSEDKYLRGALFWKWTRFKFLACRMTKNAFVERLEGGYLEKYGIKKVSDVSFVK